mgnify:FL=1
MVKWEALLTDFLAMVFPEVCFSCQQALWKGEQHLCTKCIGFLSKTYFHQYPKDNPLYEKFWGLSLLDHSLAFLKFSKGGKTQRLLHALKYKQQPALGVYLGRLYAADLCAAGYQPPFNLVLPIPLHVEKFRQRGYNQAACFAKGLAEGLGLAFREDLLLRNKNTATQTRKGRFERWENVDSIFEVAEVEAVQGKHILLVDDVVTTGATMQACLKMLQTQPVEALSVAALAIA